jgi:type IV pilus assembly protein PilQ
MRSKSEASSKKDTRRAQGLRVWGRSEMRRQLLAIFLPLLILVLVAAAAETPNPGSAAHAALQRLNVVRSDDGIRIEITARGPVTPKVSALSSPARLVVDLPNTVEAVAQRNIAVDGDGVKGLRVGMDGHTPPNTRIVVDLDKACQYELEPSTDGKMILKLHTGSVAAKKMATPALKPVVMAAAPKVTAPVASAPVAAAPSVAATSAPAPAKAASASNANGFVFVEPSYKPKDESKADSKPAVQPEVRATEAAAKFADKTATELLPVKANATMQADAPAQQAGQNAPMPNAAIQPAVNLAAEQKTQMAQRPAASGPKYTGEPISVNLKDVDLKDFFRLIHEISGLNVVLDPNVHGNLTVVLDDVPWDQALDIVLKNNDLDRELEGNVLRIATVDTLKKEAEARHAQKEAEALAVEKVTVTRFLSYAHSKDVVPTVKKFLTLRGDVMSDDRTNAVIISDIPSVIPGLDRLLTQLDRKTQEVEIEARVVAATRSFARDIGTQFGFGWGNSVSAIGGASSVGTSPTTVNGLTPSYIVTSGGSSGGSSTGAQIPLFSNMPVPSPTSGLTFVNATNNVRIDAVLTMAESRGLLKILSRPRIATQNNIQAVVRQGVRVPIVTQAQLGGPPTVTYVDAFLRLTVTPQITSEGTIFLNVDVENTTPDFGRTVQGNPTLITQQATTQVLVTDGGTVVIGGVIQTNNSLSVQQVPLLGDVPYLGNLFKRRTVTTSNQELIFFITPRIIQT